MPRTGPRKRTAPRPKQRPPEEVPPEALENRARKNRRPVAAEIREQLGNSTDAPDGSGSSPRE